MPKPGENENRNKFAFLSLFSLINGMNFEYIKLRFVQKMFLLLRSKAMSGVVQIMVTFKEVLKIS